MPNWGCPKCTGHNAIGDRTCPAELLMTLMAEVTGIVNSHPIATIPSGVDEPQQLTPAMLLTMKTRSLVPTRSHLVQQDLYAHKWWRMVEEAIPAKQY